jgi:hypothetical protein
MSYLTTLEDERRTLRFRIGVTMTRYGQYQEPAWKDMYLRQADRLAVQLLQVEAKMEKENSRY